MAAHVCPVWVGYFLLNPLRGWLENPQKILTPLVSPGMTVLEAGCAMGFFTLPLARMVGPQGRVVAVDLQKKMLDKLSRRAHNAGLEPLIQTRLAQEGSLGVEDLAGSVDLAVAIHVVHEVPDQKSFFSQLFSALKRGGKLLVKEPKGHVSHQDFEATVKLAQEVGFGKAQPGPEGKGLAVVLSKQ